MTLPASGPLSMADIQTEFGGSNPISLSEYYAGGGLVPSGTTGTYGAVPSSGTLSIQNFYGTSNYIPVGWIGLFGSPTNSSAQAVAVDSSGNVYITGFTAYTPSAIMLSKYNTSGVIQWQRELSGFITGGIGYGIAVDSSGNIYVCGTTTNSSYNGDGLIAKYNSSGVVQWQRSLVGSLSFYYDGCAELALDSSNNVYVTGSSNASGSFCFQTEKYNSSGVLQWQRRFGDTGNEEGESLVVDGSGNIYVSGRSGSTNSAQLVKYDTNGVIQWQRKLGGSGANAARGIALDSSGNIYVCGHSSSSGTFDCLIAKYNSSGVVQWQRRLGDSGNDFGLSIKLDSSGNIYVGGYFDYVTFGTRKQYLLAKYNNSGVIQWQRRLGSGGDDFGYSIALDSSGKIYICGDSSTIGKALFAKLPNDGSATGVYTVGGYSITYAASTLTDAALSLTDSATSYTDAASSLVDSATSYADNATTLTYSVTSI